MFAAKLPPHLGGIAGISVQASFEGLHLAYKKGYSPPDSEGGSKSLLCRE